MNPNQRLKVLKERLWPPQPIRPTYDLYNDLKQVLRLHSMSYFQFEKLIGVVNEFVTKNNIK